MISRQHIVHERAIIIPINQNLSTSMKATSPTSEYSLKQNFFDPSKSSPPNEFMMKLHMRMNMYNKTIYADMNDESLDKE
jgi:hypothetical protein